MTTILVLGAGGSDGGRFIDGALAELAASTGFVPEHADAIIGTSVGSFRAAGIGTPMSQPSEVTAALRRLGGPRPEQRWLDRSAHRLRVALGQAVTVAVPRSRPSPQWSTPPGPYHAGAHVISVDVDERRRATHALSTTPDPAAAVRASAAIPFAFGPVGLHGSAHSDGAIWSPTNADLATAVPETPSPGAIVIVVAPMVPYTGGTPLDRIHRRQLRSELAHLPPTAMVAAICPAPGPRRVVRTSQAGAAAVQTLLSGGSPLLS